MNRIKYISSIVVNVHIMLLNITSECLLSVKDYASMFL